MSDLNFTEVKNGVAKFHLSGRLDAANAPDLLEKLKKLAGQNVSEIIFDMKDLAYISSAGLRIMAFAKQKMGGETQVYIISPSTAVLDVIKMTGFDNFLNIRD